MIISMLIRRADGL